MLILQIVLGIVGLFLLQFLEHFLLALFNIRAMFVLFLFLYKKIDWQILLPFTVLTTIILDVTMHYKLGTNLLLFVIPLSVLSLLSLVFSAEDGIVSYILKFLISLLYYILNALLPSLLLDGKWGVLNGKMFLLCIWKAVVTTVLLVLLDTFMDRFRKRGNTSQIRLK